jgi:hypothetical protein
VAGCFEDGSEPFESIKGGKFLDLRQGAPKEKTAVLDFRHPLVSTSKTVSPVKSYVAVVGNLMLDIPPADAHRQQNTAEQAHGR